ncbi:Retrotransposon gag protein [Abeliophyllum distichum]|uniref:Retrotransposon gag protein n=1 Tax=Abeliophyllum distichum TaxID=126358 RepID=A0ABD1W164_9LAMI
MEKYDGSSDLVNHLRTFIDLIRLRATPNAIMCRAFLPTLSSKCTKKTDIGLMQLTQYKDKLLKNFIAQFNRAALEIKDLQMSAVVTAKINGTRISPFKMSISKNLPDTVIRCMSY